MGYPPVGYPQGGVMGYPGAAGGPPTGPHWGGPAQTVVVQGGYDAGARFDGSSGPSIPVSGGGLG